MNFALVKEIYKLTPWFVDSTSLPGLLGVLENITNLEIPDVRYNTPELLYSEETRIIERPYGSDWWPGQLDNNDKFSGIALIKINGPIMLNDGASTLGMKTLSDLMLKMHKDERIKAFIIYADSGGGASSAVEVMSDTINEIKETTPVIGLIQKGGMAASACYGILSACDKIYSESEMNIVGSAGTMIQFAGRAANVEGDDKVKYLRFYASKSTHKNKGFEEALNNDNYKLLIDELLNPINERFLEMIELNRPILKGSDFDNGHTVFSKDGIGTFIDGIKSFEEVVESLEENLEIKTNTLNNNVIMNRSELESKHPALFNEILNEGVKSGISNERDRAGAWLAHLATDPKSVLEGVKSGKAITATETQEFIVKQASKAQLKNLEIDSPESIAAKEAAAKEAKTESNKEDEEVLSFYNEIDSKLNLSKTN